MHELLAPLLHALESDAAALHPSSCAGLAGISTSTSGDGGAGGAGGGGGGCGDGVAPHVLSLADGRHLEADAFLLFESLMDDMAPW